MPGTLVSMFNEFRLNSHNNPVKWLLLLPHFTAEKTEAAGHGFAPGHTADRVSRSGFEPTQEEAL